MNGNTIVFGKPGQGKTTYLKKLCNILKDSNVQLIVAGEEYEYSCFKDIPNVHLITLEQIEGNETLLSATLKSVEKIINDRRNASKEKMATYPTLIAVVDGLYGEDFHGNLWSEIIKHSDFYNSCFIMNNVLFN